MNSAELHVIIPAAGSQSRWGGYQSVNKLLLPVHGEPLLQRTLRQLREKGHEAIVIGNGDALGVEASRPRKESALSDTGIGHSVEFWSSNRRNLILFGDVAWSDEGLELALAARAPGVTWFGRASPGRFNRGRRELFGLSFPPAFRTMFEATIRAFAAIRPPGIKAGGWPLYEILRGKPWNSYTPPSEHFVEIDDETSDFDTRADYKQWRELFEKPVGRA